MAQANTDNSITSRRRFPTVAAAASAVSATALAAAAMPVHQTCLDDSGLLTLEELVFAQYELAMAHNDEIRRLSENWGAESNRLYEEALSREVQAASYLTPEERWALVTEMPECKEHDRLCRLQEIHLLKMEALVKQMWAIPALTPEGRRAKVLVALRLLPDRWRRVDDDADYGVLMARQLFIEFVGRRAWGRASRPIRVILAQSRRGVPAFRTYTRGRLPPTTSARRFTLAGCRHPRLGYLNRPVCARGRQAQNH